MPSKNRTDSLLSTGYFFKIYFYLSPLIAQSLFKMFDKGQSQSINTQDLARAMVKNAMQNSNLNQPSETLEHGDIVKLL